MKYPTMKTTFTKLALLAAIGTASATPVIAQEAYHVADSTHWRQQSAAPTSKTAANQLDKYGYAVSSPAARAVTIDGGTRHLNVTRLETVRITVNGKSVTWKFDTLGTVPFPLSQIVPGVEGVTVYVADTPVT